MKTGHVPAPEAVEDEVVALITTLHETEQRLEALTGGQVDTVSDRFGRPYLLRRAQEELRDREADKQAAILNALPAHIALLDATGVIISVNETWRRFASANFLSEPAFGIGLNYLDLCDRVRGPEESDAHQTAAGIRAVLAGEKDFSFEYPCHSPTEQRWFLMTVTRLAGDLVRGAVVMHLNITHRKQSEQATARALRRLTEAQRIAQVGDWEWDLATQAITWSPEVFSILGRDPGLGPPRSYEEQNALYDAPSSARLQKSITQAIESGEPQNYELVALRPDGARIAVQAMAVPRKDERGKVVGISGTIQDITARKRSEAALAESESRYHSLFGNMLEGYAYCEALFEQDQLRDFIYLEVNSAFEKITGLKNVSGKKVSELIPGVRDADYALFEIYGRVALTGKSEKCEVHLKALDMWLSVAVYSSDRDHFVVVFDDITERRRAEDATRATKKRLRDLIDGLGTSMMVGMMTPDGILVEANAPALAAAGLQPADVIGKPFVDSRWFAYSAEVQQQLRDAIARGVRGEASRYDMKVCGVNGLIDIDFVLNPVRDEAGNIAFLVPSGNVITERKRAETELRESNEKFHQLADNISDAFWIRSPDMSEVQYVSPAFEKIWGRSVASLRARPHEWSDFIFPEDRPRVVAAFDTLTSSGPSLDIEYRIVRPDGELRWVRVRGAQIRNEADHLIRHIGIVSDITDRKQTEKELQWKTAFLEAQVASSPDGILVVDEHGKKNLQNPRMAELLGIPPHIAEDREDSRQLEWVAAAVTQPRDFVEKVAYLNSHPSEISRDEIEFKSGRTLDRYSAPVIGKDGQYYGRIWTFRDVTERKQSMEALRASEGRFKAVFDQAAVGVAQSDALTGQIVRANQRFADIVGRTRPEVEQLNVAGLTHPQDVVRDRELMEQLKAGLVREYAREKRYVRKDGSDVWVSLTVSAMWAPGEAPGLCIGIVQDITERKRLDEHFLQAQKMEALGQFSGGVAHDFNNILATISGYTELSRMLLQGNSEVRAHLDAVLKASGRAADLVNQILTFSRQQPQERQTIQLQRVVAESVKLLRATIPSTIAFDVSIAADAPAVFGNANQIHQVLTNLGVNAWHAMQDGPGRLQITLEKWRVDDAHAVAQPRLRPGRYARVSVSDTGCGMDAATVRRIFEPFFTTKPVGQGTGLGLAVVHGIMDAHDGAVTVYSQPGEGTVFHLYFPAHAGEPAAEAAAEGAIPRGRGEAVLVVDDEETIASMIQQTLIRLDYAAEFASDSAAALALVQANPAHFKLVLSDQTMPGMTGLGLATRLREIRPDLPVLLMTGFSASLTPARLEAAGVRQVLFKPLTVQTLAVALHAVLSAPPP